MPQTPQSAWTRDSASNTSQYSGSAWGSQPPEGDILLPFASHCWTQSGGLCGVLPGHAEGKEHADAAALLS